MTDTQIICLLAMIIDGLIAIRLVVLLCEKYKRKDPDVIVTRTIIKTFLITSAFSYFGIFVYGLI